MHPRPNARLRQAGQSLIESCIAIAILSLLLFGMLQISQILAAKEVLQHAAARGARARSVGFNHWMVKKVIRLGAIANAGALETPTYDNDSPFLDDLVANNKPAAVWSTLLPIDPKSAQFPIERARMPAYLGSPDPSVAGNILDYKDWDSISYGLIEDQPIPGANPETARMIEVRTVQSFPLWVPMHRAFYNDDAVPLEGIANIESHAALYLTDEGW